MITMNTNMTNTKNMMKSNIKKGILFRMHGMDNSKLCSFNLDQEFFTM